MPTTIDLDPTLLRQMVERQALIGLRRATEYTLERARHHAPVRAIFKRGTRGHETPRSWATMRSHKRYQAFLDSMARRRAIDIHNVRGVAAGDIGIGPQEITSQTSAAGPRSWRKPHLTQRTGFSGHPNTLIPVFRSGRYTVTGDFRRLGPLAGAIGQNRGRAGRKAKRPEFVDAQKAEGYRAAQLTSAGRYEVRQALKRTSRSALFQGRVGGRLRGELRIRGPERHAGSWWMYVESPTPYAPYQEFGTAHNRAHPFLRPALYESRNVLRFEVRKAVDPRVNTLPAEG